MVKAVKRRSVSSVSVRSDGSLQKTKSSPVVGAHGARDGRAVERAEGAVGAEGRRATAQDDAQGIPTKSQSSQVKSSEGKVKSFLPGGLGRQCTCMCRRLE